MGKKKKGLVRKGIQTTIKNNGHGHRNIGTEGNQAAGNGDRPGGAMDSGFLGGAGKRGCNCPAGCVLGVPIPAGSRELPFGAVCVRCTNENCPAVPWLHAECYEKWEDFLMRVVKSAAGIKKASDRESKRNLWKQLSDITNPHSHCTECRGYVSREYAEEKLVLGSLSSKAKKRPVKTLPSLVTNEPPPQYHLRQKPVVHRETEVSNNQKRMPIASKGVGADRERELNQSGSSRSRTQSGASSTSRNIDCDQSHKNNPSRSGSRGHSTASSVMDCGRSHEIMDEVSEDESDNETDASGFTRSQYLRALKNLLKLHGGCIPEDHVEAQALFERVGVTLMEEICSFGGLSHWLSNHSPKICILRREILLKDLQRVPDRIEGIGTVIELVDNDSDSGRNKGLIDCLQKDTKIWFDGSCELNLPEGSEDVSLGDIVSFLAVGTKHPINGCKFFVLEMAVLQTARQRESVVGRGAANPLEIDESLNDISEGTDDADDVYDALCGGGRMVSKEYVTKGDTGTVQNMFWGMRTGSSDSEEEEESQSSNGKDKNSEVPVPGAPHEAEGPEPDWTTVQVRKKLAPTREKEKRRRPKKRGEFSSDMVMPVVDNATELVSNAEEIGIASGAEEEGAEEIDQAVRKHKTGSAKRREKLVKLQGSSATDSTSKLTTALAVSEDENSKSKEESGPPMDVGKSISVSENEELATTVKRQPTCPVASVDTHIFSESYVELYHANLGDSSAQIVGTKNVERLATDAVESRSKLKESVPSTLTSTMDTSKKAWRRDGFAVLDRSCCQVHIRGAESRSFTARPGVVVHNDNVKVPVPFEVPVHDGVQKTAIEENSESVAKGSSIPTAVVAPESHVPQTAENVTENFSEEGKKEEEDGEVEIPDAYAQALKEHLGNKEVKYDDEADLEQWEAVLAELMQ